MANTQKKRKYEIKNAERKHTAAVANGKLAHPNPIKQQLHTIRPWECVFQAMINLKSKMRPLGDRTAAPHKGVTSWNEFLIRSFKLPIDPHTGDPK